MVTALIITAVKGPDGLGEVITVVGDMMSGTAMLRRVVLSALGITVAKWSRDKELAAGGPPSSDVIQTIAYLLKK